MAEISHPRQLDPAFADLLRSRKSDFVSVIDGAPNVNQHGAARLDPDSWPGWPCDLHFPQLAAPAADQTDCATSEAVIETFVAGADQVEPMSDNTPFVSAWRPLAEWMNRTLRAALTAVDVDLVGDAYVTSSLTPVALLAGSAHLDDDLFIPSDSVSVVAVIGEHAGPRVATEAIAPRSFRPMSQVQFEPVLLESFANSGLDHCQCGADELVVFPQFGQLHSGPATHHLAGVQDQPNSRQLLVLRASTQPRGASDR